MPSLLPSNSYFSASACVLELLQLLIRFMYVYTAVYSNFLKRIRVMDRYNKLLWKILRNIMHIEKLPFWVWSYSVPRYKNSCNSAIKWATAFKFSVKCHIDLIMQNPALSIKIFCQRIPFFVWTVTFVYILWLMTSRIHRGQDKL